MKIKPTVLIILLFTFISYSQAQLYSSWYDDPRWNRPIIHSVVWTAGLSLAGGLIGFAHAKATDAWPAYEEGIEMTIGSLIGAGVGFPCGLTFGIISGRKIHKRNIASKGLSVSFEF